MPLRAVGRSIACVLLALLVSRAAAQKPQTTGVYTDARGAQHAWSITAANALVWDGKPFVPVGGVFCPRYLHGPPTEENWAADISVLESLKARGLLDLIIQPVVSVLGVPASAWQRLVDYLDANGFRYGVAFGSGVDAPLTAYLVRPTTYRIANLRDGTDIVWEVADSPDARYALVDPADATQLLNEGVVRVRDGTATVPGSRVIEGAVAILYPRRVVRPSRDGWLPDVWSSFGRYRDALLVTLKDVKFGPGLRFFLDPLGYNLSLAGDLDFLVPTSPGFRLEYEAWLRRRYPTLDALQRAWAIAGAELKDYAEAARLVPMWEYRSGLPFFFDPDTNRRIAVAGSPPKFWDDLRDCRNESLALYMNALADLLKREIANVPVVYSRTHQSRIFTNPERTGGFDGLGMIAYARGSALITSGADSTYSQAQESGKTLWCIVTETLDTSVSRKTTLGYGSREAMAADLDWLRGMGAKGLYVNGFQVLPEQEYRNFQLASDPSQLEWLKAYADSVANDSRVAGRQPRVIPFPASAGGMVQAGPIASSSVMWVPSLATGRPLDFGSSYGAYVIAEGEGSSTVIWSLRGPRQTRLYLAEPEKLEAYTVDGTPLPLKVDKKKKTATLVIGDEPIILRKNDQATLPIEAVEDAIKQLRWLIAKALADGLPALDYRYQLERAERFYKANDMLRAYSILQDAIARLVETSLPYTWVEAEAAEKHTFTEMPRLEGASSANILVLNTTLKPEGDGYAAEYQLSVPAEGEYTVWVACSPPGPQASPFLWSIGTGQRRSSTEARVVGEPFLGGRFVWMNLGIAPLKAGRHPFTLIVNETAEATGRYFLALDAILLTRDAFTPRGTSRPAIPETPVKLERPKISVPETRTGR